MFNFKSDSYENTVFSEINRTFFKHFQPLSLSVLATDDDRLHELTVKVQALVFMNKPESVTRETKLGGLFVVLNANNVDSFSV